MLNTIHANEAAQEDRLSCAQPVALRRARQGCFSAPTGYEIELGGGSGSRLWGRWPRREAFVEFAVAKAIEKVLYGRNEIVA